MPVYEYSCRDCGIFEEMRPMRQFSEPCDCPTCGTASPRVMLSVPAFSSVSSAHRKSHEINERSADSPKRTSTHGPNCSCCGGGAKKGRKTLHRPDGSKSFPSARPWMISH
ncbi:MAG: zinc ribbon domain-containing protein [Pseudomonadota bacterium]